MILVSPNPGEIVARIPGEEESVPSRRNGAYFYARHVEGGEYAVYCRKVGSLQAEEEILLDGNEAARGHDFFQVRGVSVCPRPVGLQSAARA